MVRARVSVRVCTIHTPLFATTSLACLAKGSHVYLRRWLYNLLAVHTLQPALLTTYLPCTRYRPRYLQRTCCAHVTACAIYNVPVVRTLQAALQTLITRREPSYAAALCARPLGVCAAPLSLAQVTFW